jgi:hypothetical protein
MAITVEPIIRHDASLKIGSTITRWATFVFRIVEGATADPNVADSLEDETIITKTRIEFTCTGMLGALNNAGTLPFPGDTILAADLALAIGADSLLPSLSGYTNIKIVLPWEISAAQDPMSWSIAGRSGVRRIILPS